MEHVIFITGLRTTEMVLCGWGVRCDGCRVWHAKLAFLTVAALMIISRTVTADAENHRNSEAGERPHIVNNGSEIVVEAGHDVQFTCEAHGTPPPFVLWYKDDNILDQRHPRFEFRKHVLSISSVRVGDAGEYICCAENVHGQTCTNFSLVVQPPDDGQAPTWSPDMDLSTTELLKLAGKTVQLRCPADGHPTPTIHWLKNGRNFTDRPIGRIRLVNSRFLMRLADVNQEDIGYYTCVVSNEFGQLNWTRNLDVIVRLFHPPIITNGPQNQTVEAGDSARFTCRLLSDPEYHLQWHKHLLISGSYVSVNFTRNVRIVNAQVSSELPLGGSDLVLDDVTDDDIGLYTCSVASLLGMTQQSAWLTVLPAALLVLDDPDDDDDVTSVHLPKMPTSPPLPKWSKGFYLLRTLWAVWFISTLISSLLGKHEDLEDLWGMWGCNTRPIICDLPIGDHVTHELKISAV